ncbi:MAG: TauD/TfdA family dioxygenase [Pseudomonadota bacterium]|nr:TauD/TfdA family dioxygenase [Pseudomonadota bacterium]
MNSALTACSDDYMIRPVSEALGAEVIGLDVSKPLDAGILQVIQQAFLDHHLLVFRDQVLSGEEQVAFSKQFGALEAFPEADKTKGAIEIYNVANVSPEGEQFDINDHRAIYQKVNARFHTDSSYRSIPSLASIMYGIEVLPEQAEGGETEFSNMFKAYEALSKTMKAHLEPLHMVHYYEFGRRLYPELPPVPIEERRMVPPVTHPLIRVHPDRDNRRSLFVTTNAGNEIGGMTLEEGQALHGELAEHVARPEFCHRHRWKVGDLVMWDNRCLLHRAIAYDMAKHRRVLRRTTVGGSGPVIGPFAAPL